MSHQATRIVNRKNALTATHGALIFDPMKRTRPNLYISADTDAKLARAAEERGITKAEMIRRSIDLMLCADAARSKGQTLGFVEDASKLDTVIVGLD